MIRILIAAACAAALAGCANSPEAKADFAAKNRPLEVRCVRAQTSYKTPAEPNQTAAQKQKEAQLAASRGELDKACDWL
jgi:ABC-type uncharacterized transport system auxiliary subunit